MTITLDPTRTPVRTAFGPNRFTSVMGTGIVANAAATLGVPGLRGPATVVWAAAAVLLVVLCAAWARRWREVRADDPVMAQFWGAPPIALVTVGAGALLLGKDWIGLGPALTLDWALWTAGTVFGLVTAVRIPYRMMTALDVAPGSAFGGWLLPVVPPMVSAAGGAALIAHLPDGGFRLGMLLACAAMVGVSVLATLVVLPQLWQRLVHHRIGAAGVPTTWIVLGALGQSIAAVNLLGDETAAVLPEPYGSAGAVVGLFYGVPVWGFALLWLALAAALTLRTARRGLPFSVAWWSFTFPLGALVSGTNALAARVHSGLFTGTATALYALLVAVWATVVVRTVLALRRPAEPVQ